MKKNFRLGQSNEIITPSRVYDLHNLYDYFGISLIGGNRQLNIIFSPNLEFGKGNLSVMLKFNEIQYLEFSPNFGSDPICDLDEMGYKAPDDRDDEWLMSQRQSTENDHLFLRFENNEFIRVFSNHAALINLTSIRCANLAGMQTGAT